MSVDIRRLRALAGSRKTKPQPSVRSQIRRSEQGEGENRLLLEACANDWHQLDGKRREHERFMRYLGGDQWGDMVPDPDHPGRMILEKALISRTGIVPITNNIIQEFTRNILGQMLSNRYQTIVNARREEDSEIANMLTNTVQACLDLNQNSTLDINHVMALVSIGISWGKVTFAPWDERNDSDGKIFHVNQNRIAWNQDCEDPRLFDLRRICELHDYTMTELVANFARTSSDEAALKELYATENSRRRIGEAYTRKATDTLPSLNFWFGSEPNKCRVIEVWEKRGRWVLWIHDRATAELPREYTEDFRAVEREVDAENARRRTQALEAGLSEEDVADASIEYERRYEEYWYVKYLTPHGVCLLEMETPYAHQQHPYVFAAMPIVDGMVKPLLSDLIEIQRNINRQRTLLDAIIAGSAKNTLFVPEEAIPADMKLEDYAAEIIKINGVVKYSPKPNVPLPEFLSRNSTNIGIWEVLNFDMQQAREISGLTGALQGQVAKAGTPSSLYAQQAQNALLNFVILFDRFNEYCTKRDDKLLKVLIQFYDKRRHLAVAGRSFESAASEYIPEKAQAIADNYSLVMSQAAYSPAFRQLNEDKLANLLQMGLPLELFLENTSMPFGKKLLAQLRSLKQQQEQQQVDPALLADVQQQAAGQSDPQAMQMLSRMLGVPAAATGQQTGLPA